MRRLVIALIITLSPLQIGAKVCGVHFNPETYQYNSPAMPFGRAWYDWYELAQPQVKDELEAIRGAGFSHIFWSISAVERLSWPKPYAFEVERLARFLSDVRDAGLKIVLGMGTPCVIPNSVVPPGAPKEHVGGHSAGDIVNGFQLYWDVPLCTDDYIAEAKEWYFRVLVQLEYAMSYKFNSSIDVIEHLDLSGTPWVPFASEMSIFNDHHPTYIQAAQAYLSALVPYLRSITSIPISINLLPPPWETPDRQYEFLDNVLAAVPIDVWDALEFKATAYHSTYGYSLSVDEILSRIGPENAYKVVLNDFGYRDSSLSQTDATAYWTNEALRNNLGGFWIWQYKDDQQNPLQVGLRERGYIGDHPHGWKQAVMEAITCE